MPCGSSLYEVVADGDTVYSVYLMWSDLKSNHNKYYVMQLLQRKGTDAKSGVQCAIWIRYGRVGNCGGTSLVWGDYTNRVKEFTKQMKAKLRKGYKEIKMAMGDNKDGQAGGSKNPNDSKIDASTYLPSKLDASVQALVDFIFDKKLMEESVAKAGIDLKRMPLGELSQATVVKGYSILR